MGEDVNLEGLAIIPVDCLPSIGQWIEVSPFETGHSAEGEIEGGELRDGTLSGTVKHIEWKYGYIQDAEDLLVTVNIYIDLDLLEDGFDFGVGTWAKSHGLKIEAKKSKALLLVETAPSAE